MVVSDSATPWTVANQTPLCGWLQPNLLWDFLGKNTGMGSHSLLQGIFPTQRLNPGLLHCRQILYHLSHQGSFPSDSAGKESACNAGDTGDVGSIPGSGRSPGGGNSNPLQCYWWTIPWTEEPGGDGIMYFTFFPANRCFNLPPMPLNPEINVFAGLRISRAFFTPFPARPCGFALK